jgi:hypothetical protein
MQQQKLKAKEKMRENHNNFIQYLYPRPFAFKWWQILLAWLENNDDIDKEKVNVIPPLSIIANSQGRQVSAVGKFGGQRN